jgi:hypothetical protein
LAQGAPGVLGNTIEEPAARANPVDIAPMTRVFEKVSTDGKMPRIDCGPKHSIAKGPLPPASKWPTHHGAASAKT